MNPSPQEPTVLATIEQVTRILAIAIAGAWAYYFYFRGRTFRPRLEPVVTGEIVKLNTDYFIIATSTVKNVGLSRVTLDRRGTGVKLSTFDGEAPAFVDVDWTLGAVFDILAAHDWIEPGETVQSQTIVRLADGQVAARLEIRIVSGRHEWSAERIVAYPAAHPKFHAVHRGA